MPLSGHSKEDESCGAPVIDYEQLQDHGCLARHNVCIDQACHCYAMCADSQCIHACEKVNADPARHECQRSNAHHQKMGLTKCSCWSAPAEPLHHL